MDFKLFVRHNRNSHFCRIPGVRCACCQNNSSSASYEKFENQNLIEMGSVSLINEEQDNDDSSSTASQSEKNQENIKFYNDDDSHHEIVVEKSLCVFDICQLLAVKNRMPKNGKYGIVEYWGEHGLERNLEDHEYVLNAKRDIKTYRQKAQVRYFFRKDNAKYELFNTPELFFPSEMVDEELSNERSVRQTVTEDVKCPLIMSSAWIQDSVNCEGGWRKGFMFLRDNNLYVSFTPGPIVTHIRNLRKEKPDYTLPQGLFLWCHIPDYYAYTPINARRHLSAPSCWALALRPAAPQKHAETPPLLCFACDTEQIRTCWLTGMRLAKYGKQLRENYKAYKNKQSENMGQKDYNSYTVPNESIRSRVAMDFTGSVGRIVEDPKEVKAIALAEGFAWKKRLKTPGRINVPANIKLEHLNGVHLTQPWYHGTMTREEATSLVSRHGSVDGVFLVRESRSNPGSFVLTYKCGGRVLHTQITPLKDPIRDTYVFSLDNGVTKFYDLLQLVEFYQLNAGCLPTRLTHYVVQNDHQQQLQQKEKEKENNTKHKD